MPKIHVSLRPVEKNMETLEKLITDCSNSNGLH